MQEIENYLKKIKKPVSMLKILEKASLLGEYDAEKVINLVKEKVSNYELIVTDSGKYIPIKRTSFKVGKFHAYKNGTGAVETSSEKIIISEEESSKLIDGDIVFMDASIKGCRIKKIISRDVLEIVGEIVKENDKYYVIPESNKKKNLTIYLEGDNYLEGEKVIVDCKEEIGDNLYIGTITKEIGYKNDPGVDILMEAHKYNITNDITEKEKEELKTIPKKVLDADKIGRMDFTHKQIFTIDGEHSKDLDDAISIDILDNGNYLLGVYIADVSHYIKKGSLLDLRARRKGTSSYLADTVIPMFPPEISNGICSLNPNVERLALGCLIEFDKDGNRVNYNINKFVIKSNLKMTYEKVNDILEKGIIDEEYKPFIGSLKRMEILSKKLFRNRVKRGSIEINKAEIELIMDNNSQVEGFSKRYHGSSESIVQEFMIVANETIAEDMFKNEYPYIFRNHEEPNEDKMREYINLLKAIGIKERIDINDSNLGQRLGEIANKDSFLSETLKTRLLKSFRRAYYDSYNIGHYGLGSVAYGHFTSPIRRYPDTTNHRLVKDFHFSDKDREKLKSEWKKDLESISKKSSLCERNADEAERMVTLMKCAEYMEKHIGESFIGTVVELSHNGLQIELDNMVTGMVRAKYMAGDYYYYPLTESYLSLSGNDDYYLGDRLVLEVVSARKETKEINFKVLSKIEESKKIKKEANNKVRVKEKERRQDMLYYNVNKGKRNI